MPLLTLNPLRPVLLIEDSAEKRVVKLDQNIYSIGRSAKNTIVLNSALVSRYHATLIRLKEIEGNYYCFKIIDGDLRNHRSSNGLIINGKNSLEHILEDKDIIVFGGIAKATYLCVDSTLSAEEIIAYSESGKSLDGSHSDTILDPTATLITAEEEGQSANDKILLRLASFPELLPIPIIEIDLTGTITYLNPSALLKFPDLPTAKLNHEALAGLVEMVQDKADKLFIREVKIGEQIYEQSLHLLEETAAIRCYLVDITDRKRIESALRESEERYALAARAANDGLWDWNLQTQEIYYSPRWKTMLGYEESEIGNSAEEWFNRLHSEDIDRVRTELAAHIEGATSQFESEYKMLHKNGTYRWFLNRGIAVQDITGRVYRIAGSHADITDRKKAEADLHHNAFHDTLTGLSNRLLFMDRLKHALEVAKRRPDYVLAVLFLDLDRFKIINDSLGHQSGDDLLKGLVERLSTCIRSGDTFARLGGDEFAILLEDIKTVQEAEEVANRIQEQFQLPFKLNYQEVFTSTSIGIAMSTLDYNDPAELVRDADIAMYHAKALGKARFAVFDATMHERAVSILQLENDLRRAISTSEFQINYQPIVSLSSGKITGFEALLRWQHPERGGISPQEFIPVAEETGVIVPIGYWVLGEACRQLCIWHQRFPNSPPLTMSVNLSGRQFREPDLLERIETILRETGINPSTLKLEITESIIMENAEGAITTLMRLRSLGVQIYIDDFGTGYSSLSYLHRFPFDALKIDRSFINRMCIDSESSEIVQTIFTLARNLGTYIVAEGVETAEQQECLKRMNGESSHAQGYYFSKPLDSMRIEDLLDQELEQNQASQL